MSRRLRARVEKLERAAGDTPDDGRPLYLMTDYAADGRFRV
jgi:hypothetical protein